MSLPRWKMAFAVTWLSWCTLFVQQGYDSWVHAAPGFIWVVKLVPLLMFVPGMLRDNLRSFIWLCFVSLGYFLVLVQRAFAESADFSVWVGLTAVVALFTAAMLYVRWRAQALRAHP